jgi:ABC-type branched-subunit amino acid transport system ATPase component
MKPIVAVRRLTKHFNGIAALSQFSCSVAPRQILGLFGPNGAGKSTLFNTISGFLVADAGSVTFNGIELLGRQPNTIANFGIARTFQEVRLVRDLTVMDNVLLFFRSQPGERLTNIFLRPRLCSQRESDNRTRAETILQKAGLLDKACDHAENLSYGQQRLLCLVCCLAADAELLLLDEPVAGVSPEFTDRMLQIIGGLPSQGKSAIIISHNVEALRSVCDRLVFMNAGENICEGTPDEVLGDPLVMEAYLN